MCAFVVLGLVFPYQAKKLAWECLRNDLFCIKWDVKPQSISAVTLCVGQQEGDLAHEKNCCNYPQMFSFLGLTQPGVNRDKKAH